jgi:hypothetical protein
MHEFVPEPVMVTALPMSRLFIERKESHEQWNRVIKDLAVDLQLLKHVIQSLGYDIRETVTRPGENGNSHY